MLKTRKQKFYEFEFYEWRESSLRVTLTQKEQIIKKIMCEYKKNSNNNYKATNLVKDNDWRVKQLKLIIIIFVHERIKVDKRLCKYIKAFIERLNWIINKKLNTIHDMFKAWISLKNKLKKFKKLNYHRYYDLCNIIRNIHFVLTKQSCTRFFLTTLLTESNITWSSILNLFKTKFIMSMSD